MNRVEGETAVIQSLRNGLNSILSPGGQERVIAREAVTDLGVYNYLDARRRDAARYGGKGDEVVFGRKEALRKNQILRRMNGGEEYKKSFENAEILFCRYSEEARIGGKNDEQAVAEGFLKTIYEETHMPIDSLA